MDNRGIAGREEMRRKAKKPDTPRIWVRINHDHVAKVLQAKRQRLMFEEFVRHG